MYNDCPHRYPKIHMYSHYNPEAQIHLKSSHNWLHGKMAKVPNIFHTAKHSSWNREEIVVLVLFLCIHLLLCLRLAEPYLNWILFFDSYYQMCYMDRLCDYRLYMESSEEPLDIHVLATHQSIWLLEVDLVIT